MNSKLTILNELLNELIEGKTKVVNKLNNTVGSSLTVNSTWDDIEKAVANLNTGAGFAVSPTANGLMIVFLVNYNVVENDYGSTLQLV